VLVTRDPIVQFRSTCLFSSLFRKKNAAAATKNFKMCCTVYNLTEFDLTLLALVQFVWFCYRFFNVFFFKEDCVVYNLIVLVWLLGHYWLLFNLLCFIINFIVLKIWLHSVCTIWSMCFNLHWIWFDIVYSMKILATQCTIWPILFGFIWCT